MPENSVDWPSKWSPADNESTAGGTKPSSSGFWGTETKSEEHPPANSSTEAADTGNHGFWGTEPSAQAETANESSKTDNHGFWGETTKTSNETTSKGDSGFWGTESTTKSDETASKGKSGFWGTEPTTKADEPSDSKPARSQNYGFWDKDTSNDGNQPGKGFGGSHQGFGAPSQGFGSSNQGFGGPQRGFGSSQQGFGAPSQGFGSSNQGFGSSNQGFGGPQRGFGAATTASTLNNTATDSEAGKNTATSTTDEPDQFNFDGEVSVKLSDLQGDENSPLYSVSNFEQLGINEKILQGIYAMNFKKPSKIQEKALPILLNDPPINMIAQSQSGTGKTAAFVITILSRIDFSLNTSPQALILAPSRELARQIENVVRQIGTFLEGLTIQCAVPGSIQRNAPVESMIVVGTPGTVMDIIRRRQVLIDHLKILCLDEADNMLDMQGLGDQCLRVKNLIPPTIQTILFSATFPDPVWEYARMFSPDAAEITLPKDDLTVSGISQMFIDCPSDEGKYEILAQLYGMMTIGSSIIFVKRRETADRIAERLVADGHTVVAVHGAYDGADRDRILEEFRAGKAKVLITTNVLARGIDVSTVSMVINYDIPMKGRYEDEVDPETYLHRIGRTGRFGRTGVSISFVFDRRSFYALSAIANAFNIDLVRLDHENWDQAEKVIQAIIKTTRAA